jgi:hypothetical protein
VAEYEKKRNYGDQGSKDPGLGRLRKSRTVDGLPKPPQSDACQDAQVEEGRHIEYFPVGHLILDNRKKCGNPPD